MADVVIIKDNERRDTISPSSCEYIAQAIAHIASMARISDSFVKLRPLLLSEQKTPH